MDCIIQAMLERDEKAMTDKLAHLMCLGLGLCFLGQQARVDAALETARAMPAVISKYCELTCLTCAYAGTGNVLKIQELLHICTDHLEEKQDASHLLVAVLGIACIAMREPIGSELSLRAFENILQCVFLVNLVHCFVVLTRRVISPLLQLWRCEHQEGGASGDWTCLRIHPSGLCDRHAEQAFARQRRNGGAECDICHGIGWGW